MFRKLRFSDSDAIFAVISTHLNAGSPGSPKWSRAQVSEECEGEGFVKEDTNSALQAFILFREAGGAWEITYLATAHNALRSGAMKALLTHMIDLKPKGGAIWLEVHENNAAARDLYAKMGFKTVGKRAKYYSDGAAAILYSHG